jgi:hypothetical protein
MPFYNRGATVPVPLSADVAVAVVCVAYQPTRRNGTDQAFFRLVKEM